MESSRPPLTDYRRARVGRQTADGSRPRRHGNECGWAGDRRPPGPQAIRRSLSLPLDCAGPGTSGGRLSLCVARPVRPRARAVLAGRVADDLPGRAERLALEVLVVDHAVGIHLPKLEVLLALAVGRFHQDPNRQQVFAVEIDERNAEAFLVLRELGLDAHPITFGILADQAHLVALPGILGVHVEQERQRPFLDGLFLFVLAERKDENLLSVALVLPDLVAGADDPLEGRGKPLILLLRVPERLLLVVLGDLVEVDEGQVRALEQGAAFIIFDLAPGRVVIDSQDGHVQSLEQRALVFPLPQQPLHIGRIDGLGRGAGLPGSSALLLWPRGSGRDLSLRRGCDQSAIPLRSLAKTHGGTEHPEYQ